MCTAPYSLSDLTRIFCGQFSTQRLQLRHLLKKRSLSPAPAGRITSLSFSTSLSFNIVPAFIIPPNKRIAADAMIIRRLLKLNLVFSGIFPKFILPFGQISRHFRHLMHASLSTVFSFEFMHSEGQFFSHIPHEMHSSLFI